VLLGVLAGAPPAHAQGGAMMLDERRVVELALAAAPELRAARQERLAAEAEARMAERARWPDLVASARYARLSSLPARFRSLSFPGAEPYVLPQLLDNYNARVSLVVPISDAFLQLAAAATAAGRAAEARAIEEEASLVQVAFEARVSFLGWSRALLLREAAAEGERVARVERDGMAEQVKKGVAAPNQLLPFEAASAEAQARSAGAEAEVAAAEALLRAWLPGRGAGYTLGAAPAEEPLAQAPPPPQAPAIRALRRQVAAAEARVRASNLARLPRLSLVGTGDVSAPSPRAFAVSRLTPVPTWEVSVLLEWSLSALTTGAAAAERAAAERAALEARAAAAERRLDAERAAAAAALAGSRGRLAAAKARREAARRLAEARRQEWRAGTVLALEVITAESELTRASLAAADAVHDLRLATARLDAASGVVLPGGGR
jgi:outer membrane protein TolC